MNNLLRFFLCIAALSVGMTSAKAQKLIEAGTGYSGTSVNTPVFRASPIVTKNGVQFTAYYDGDGYLTVGRRKLDDDKFVTVRSKYQGNCKDAHNTISIGIDGNGFLHVAFDHHNSPLRYCRGKVPYSAELGELEPMTGDDEKYVTYPEFYTLPNGDLLFAYRSGGSGRGNLVMNRYDAAKASWRRLQDILIDGQGRRNAYWQMCVDKQGTIHVSWVWRETPAVETNHDLCYACSKDGGVTWMKSDGEKYQLPITADNAECAFKIPQNSELINQTSMTADDEGNPYIATYWRDADSKVPQYRLVWRDGGGWKAEQVSDRHTPFSLSGNGTKMIPVARPRLAVRRNGKKTEAYYFFRDEERGSKVSVFYCRDLRKNKWTAADLTDFSVDAWEPSYDTELWKDDGLLHLFVQHTAQGDGERTKLLAPQKVYVLEVAQKGIAKNQCQQ